MALQRIALAGAILTSLSNATPTIDLPLNSQVPPIARVSQPFSYTFPSSTFSSTLPIKYTLSSGPSWLSLNGVTRTLSGTPSANDAGAGVVTGVPISLTATDSSGSITQNATLVVSRNPAPVVSIQPSTQLPALGVFSAPSTLLYHPSTPFKIKFDSSTFSPNDGTSALKYYAVTLDNTPLPSWVTFDESSLSFSGQTPDYQSLIQPPQTFGVKLIASDVEGFSATFINFNFEVGVHLLSFSRVSMSLNVTAGDHVDFTGLEGNLQIDGQAANNSVISSIVVDKPSWLDFDNSTLKFTGTAPVGVVPATITVVATDIYGDTANATIAIAAAGSIFSKSIPRLNATIGSGFLYNMSSYLRNPSDVDISINSTATDSWISFNSTAFILSGHVPMSVSPADIEIMLTATTKSSHRSESQSFKLSLDSATDPSSSTKSSSSHTAQNKSPSQTKVSTSPQANAPNKFSKGVIVAIVLPIALAIAALLLLIFCCQKRRYDAKAASRPPSKSEISGPVLEAASSVPDIVLPPPVALPKPLELDTSGFMHGLTTNEKHVDTWKVAPRQSVRRSHTTADISDKRTSQKSDPGNSGKLVRSYSDNALSQTDTSWRSTQDTAYPTVSRSSRTNSSHRLTRTYSNYSRKGHQRRSARLLSGSAVGAALLESTAPESSAVVTSQPQGSSILNLRDDNFSLAPLENFSVLPKDLNILQAAGPTNTPEGSNRRKSAIRQSRHIVPAIHPRRRSGIGHGGRRSISSLSSMSTRRISIGHGQDWAGDVSRPRSLARNSRTWMTVATNNPSEHNRRSNFSLPSEYSDTYPAENNSNKNNALMSIRQVTKSPDVLSTICPSEASGTSRISRPVSRRLGSSPFFGGSTNRESRILSPKRVRSSYADSLTTARETMTIGSLENTILYGLREESDEALRDSFGISYGLAREGTRQLRSYIQGQMTRNKTRSSILSNESKDSRFDSAASLDQSQMLPESARTRGGNEYEDLVEADDSDGSWETQRSIRDSEGNLIEEYDGDDIIRTAEQIQRPRPHSAAAGGSGSQPTVPGIGYSARVVQGAWRRPISIDTKEVMSSHATVEPGELDYTAYV
ncbi:uncharacterized protein BP5553_05319 [Venustampulla echinocandica]|uniref:Dystroglycan-type cadherin-like domain-containing protein n=1 Tax=Venustampulla echinocandica TaxID=2656787 RepID=A0A370TQS5_9HELO|nr:uncharacterized protein BP5553_05319 [Venustampulla echinocandica]RDL37886.1 hypothetical protein BP5553_05319 [Venustampulla echinocandica]